MSRSPLSRLSLDQIHEFDRSLEQVMACVEKTYQKLPALPRHKLLPEGVYVGDEDAGPSEPTLSQQETLNIAAGVQPEDREPEPATPTSDKQLRGRVVPKPKGGYLKRKSTMPTRGRKKVVNASQRLSLVRDTTSDTVIQRVSRSKGKDRIENQENIHPTDPRVPHDPSDILDNVLNQVCKLHNKHVEEAYAEINRLESLLSVHKGSSVDPLSETVTRNVPTKPLWDPESLMANMEINVRTSSTPCRDSGFPYSQISDQATGFSDPKEEFSHLSLKGFQAGRWVKLRVYQIPGVHDHIYDMVTTEGLLDFVLDKQNRGNGSSYKVIVILSELCDLIGKESPSTVIDAKRKELIDQTDPWYLKKIIHP
ncbi:TPA_asm: hypothetical protein [Psilorhabdovirus 1]|nr:TPA_asm: hypothetical protein [Psilorhabdovirus 1]